MQQDRKEYMRAYYLANKEKLNARKRSPQSREVAKKAEERYREKKRLLAEIDALPIPTIDGIQNIIGPSCESE